MLEIAKIIDRKLQYPCIHNFTSYHRYQGPADARRIPAPNFIIGQQAFVKAKFFRTTRPSHKLSKKFLGPFEILAKAGSHSYTLRLPDTIRGVHPMFHVSMLEPAVPNEILNCVQSPPPPVDVQGELEYEIAEVLDSKIDKRRSLPATLPCPLVRI